MWEKEERIPGRLPGLSPLRRRDSADVVVDREAEVGCDERDLESPFVIRECRASVCLAAPLTGTVSGFFVSLVFTRLLQRRLPHSSATFFSISEFIT